MVYLADFWSVLMSAETSIETETNKFHQNEYENLNKISSPLHHRFATPAHVRGGNRVHGPGRTKLALH
jgi:hypothetical protein